MAKLPIVSICTPTFNRRPFIPMMIQCFFNQDYPRNDIEWIIVDDGTDKIEDLVIQIPQVKYFKFNEKMTLGRKRNFAHEQCKGEFIVYMDDDDYYPPCRISHAVNKLKENPNILCAGSSEMYIYFKHIQKLYQFGPYGENHATAATLAFRRKLLEQTSFDNNACVAEEKYFLKGYTIPFIQLDPLKTILVFSHSHNSFDKKKLLDQNDPFVRLSNKSINDFVKEKNIQHFFLEKIDDLLGKYEVGKPEYKQDVLNQIEELQNDRLARMSQHKLMQEQQKLIQEQEKMSKNNIEFCKKLSDQSVIIQELMMENKILKDKITYLENKYRKMIEERLEIYKGK
jgi:glycosyltransferase involved in cell wall biosynthesis